MFCLCGCNGTFEEEDYEIVEAGNGVQAWEIIIREIKILSAVLLNLSMPEMDGFQIIEKMRQNKLMDTIPVLIISENRNAETEGKCLYL